MEELLARIDRLPPLPDVCLKLGALMEDPRCTAAAMARVIESDAGLTASLLRLANSAFYSVPGGIQSVQRAVTALGFSAVHQVVLCTMSQEVLTQQGRGIPKWVGHHNQAVSVLSHRLATSANVPGREVALAAGLLHDVGLLAIWGVAPERMQRYLDAVQKGATHGLELERELLGADHLLLAGRLGSHWKYPPALLGAIQHHHDGGTTKTPVTPLADIVALADRWAWQLGYPGLEGATPMPLDEARAQRVNLTLDPPEDAQAGLREAIVSATHR